MSELVWLTTSEISVKGNLNFQKYFLHPYFIVVVVVNGSGVDVISNKMWGISGLLRLIFIIYSILFNNLSQFFVKSI